jgi:methylated-DNA-[protein]-cysteine S-methyltransferase
MKFPKNTVQASHDSALGRIILALSDDHLIGLWFDGQRHQPDASAWPESPEHPVAQRARAQLDEYLAGQRSTFDLPLSLHMGTEFQQAVWRALLNIPSGATRSYGAISAEIGRPAAVRAVGGAIGHNPLSIVIPCHRVVGATGALTGYAGGLARKIALLQLESPH